MKFNKYKMYNFIQKNNIRMKRLYSELLLHEVDVHRDDTCEYYDTCLDIADCMKMKSFTCIECPHYLNIQERKEYTTNDYINSCVDENIFIKNI